MFTSRAEYRILLRQDNADIRLTPLSYKLGLASKERFDKVIKKQNSIKEIIAFTKKQSVSPEETNSLLLEKGTSLLKQKVKISDVLLRPQIYVKELIETSFPFKELVSDNSYSKEVLDAAEILIKYEGYIAKEKELVTKLSKLEDTPLKYDFDYHSLKSLSTEARQKLSNIKPTTIGQASRISGISPSDINVIAVFIGR